MPYIGAKIKEEAIKKIEQSLKVWLPSDEFVVAYFKISHFKPLTDLAVITNHRLILVYVDGLKSNKGFHTEIVADEIKTVTTTKFTDNIILELNDGAKKNIGHIVAKDEKPIFLKALDKISGSPAYLGLNEKMHQATDAQKQADREKERSIKEAKREQADLIRENAKVERQERYEQKKMQRQADIEQRKLQRRAVRGTTTDIEQLQLLVKGKVSKAALREIASSCRESEMPEFILGDGINGVLVAFDDRCMVIKKGLGTSIMAGSLGGGRVATFAYRDITGIEYNSGIVTGVLEILTASYTGKTTNSPWTFGNDKSAHESSNTLPWGKIFYSQVRSEIEWLKQKVTDSKAPSFQATPIPQPFNTANELTNLAELHKQGILTDKEFTEAKQKIISKL